ncbi:tetratricopeptide repeat protein [Actinoplanes hulinensis]|uniref:Tetratricopeptide repeat protein n=1 Tax=Actinoplanes hulinensis TaxID=1144547 RepID=A0ABS7B996_9ACTN|nr:tetratricopeptide repeat protein [Actinoplanes hulinensis]MBW6437211.1 tetratricopeptide repeat protein [Actinoplanes hulinensis]
MDAPDLSLPPRLASTLADHGFLGELRREAAAGDFHCADALAARVDVGEALELYRPFAAAGRWEPNARIADRLAGSGDIDAAVAVVRSFAETGEPAATDRLVTLLADSGRVDEAVAVVRRNPENAPVARVATLLAGLDRTAEAIDLLLPRVAEGKHVRTLVEITAGSGWDERVVAALLPLGVPGPLAEVLHRQGRADEAIAVLRAAYSDGQNYHVGLIEMLADLLFEHDPDGLREFIAGDGGVFAARRLAVHLEGQGRVDEAAEILRVDDVWLLGEFLARHGRVDEAIEVLYPGGVRGADHLPVLCGLLADRGRFDEALAIVDALLESTGGTGHDLIGQRLAMLSAQGRRAQAIAEAPLDDWFARGWVAELLVEEGRLDDAVALLWPYRTEANEGIALACLMVRQGRAEEAIAVARARERPEPPRYDPRFSEPPF